MPLSGEDEPLNQTSWLSPFAMQGFNYDGFAFLFGFKCAHALFKRTMETFLFFPSCAATPSMLAHLTSQLLCVVITETP